VIDQSEEFNESALEGRRAYLDTGSGKARIRIYPDPRPSPGGTPAGVMLGEIELDKPCGIVSAGQLVLVSSVTPIAINSGEATWARWVNGNNDWAMDTSVTDVAGDGEVKLDDTTIYAGGSLTLVSAVLG
jgi:hypothetical protein